MTASKQIVITGISSELGSVLAAALASDPAVRIIGTMRRQRKPQEAFPENVFVIDECDLADAKCCTNLSQAISDRFDGPFGFVHSVGEFWEHVPFLDYRSDQAAQLFQSHVTTFYNVLQALVPVMVGKGGGSVIAFSCNSVRYSYPNMAAFTAAKSAVDSLVRSLANELSGQHLRFNSLVLASLKTHKVQESKPRGDFAHFIPPNDLVPTIRFLLSDDAYLVNGNTINLFVHSDQFYNTGYFQRVAK